MIDLPTNVGILTCSFRGDLVACRLLCRTIDRFAPWVDHRLIVPKQDLALFRPLRTPRREIVAAEDLQPNWLIGLPLPGPDWRRRLHLPRREVLVSLRGLPVRGWIVQQLRKIAAARAAPWEIVLHIDSDNVFFRPLLPTHLVRDGRVRFHRIPGGGDLATHHRWHRAAARLLGLPPTDYFGADYIGPFVIWQRRWVEQMVRRIEAVNGRDWWTTLSRTMHFAEYILYGVHVDHVAATDPGHFATADGLALSRWANAFADTADERAFLDEVRPHHVLCNLQSTIGFSEEDRLRILGSSQNLFQILR